MYLLKCFWHFFTIDFVCRPWIWENILGKYNEGRGVPHAIMNNFTFGLFKVYVQDVKEGFYKVCIKKKVLELLFYTCGGMVFMNMLDVFCMYMEFSFGWCAYGCENVGQSL